MEVETRYVVAISILFGVQSDLHHFGMLLFAGSMAAAKMNK
jgi:hypothetical protein